MNDSIPFSHPYYKLARDSYTTIRGKTWISKFKKGQCVKILLNDKYLHSAVIYEIKLMEFSEMTLQFLKRDTEYEGFELKNKDAFIALINSFRQYNKINLKETPDPVFTVIYLRKTDTDAKKNVLTQWMHIPYTSPM